MKKIVSLLLLGAAAAFAGTEADSARDAARQYGAAVRNCDMSWAVDSMYPPLRHTYADRLNTRNSDARGRHAYRAMGLETETPQEAKKRIEANERALRARYAKIGRDMKAAGIKVESYHVGEPYAEYIVTPPHAAAKTVRRDTGGKIRAEDIQSGADRSRIVVLPTTLIFSAPDRRRGTVTRVCRKSHIFAIRDEVISDRGQQRGTKVNHWYFIDGNTSVNTLRTFFPDLPLHLRTPLGSDSVL